MTRAAAAGDGGIGDPGGVNPGDATARAALLVFFDADCGFCARTVDFLRRRDVAGRVAFLPNTDPRVPRDVPRGLLDATVLALDLRSGARTTRAAAFAAVLRLLPGGRPWAWLLERRGARSLANFVYDRVARRRVSLSRAMGLDACSPGADDQPGEHPPI